MYRLSFLPQGLVFYNEEVMRPQVASLSKYDPYFLAINMIGKKKIKLVAVPSIFRVLIGHGLPSRSKMTMANRSL